MDSESIAKEIADHLRGRDDIATVTPFVDDPTRLDVKTQGGALYTVYVNGPEGVVTTDSAVGEGE